MKYRLNLHHQSASQPSPLFLYAMHGPSNRAEEQEYPHPSERSALRGQGKCMSAQWVIVCMLLAHDCVMLQGRLCTHIQGHTIQRHGFRCTYVTPEGFCVLTPVSHAFLRAYHT